MGKAEWLLNGCVCSVCIWCVSVCMCLRVEYTLVLCNGSNASFAAKPLSFFQQGPCSVWGHRCRQDNSPQSSFFPLVWNHRANLWPRLTHAGFIHNSVTQRAKLITPFLIEARSFFHQFFHWSERPSVGALMKQLIEGNTIDHPASPQSSVCVCARVAHSLQSVTLFHTICSWLQPREAEQECELFSRSHKDARLIDDAAWLSHKYIMILVGLDLRMKSSG